MAKFCSISALETKENSKREYGNSNQSLNELQLRVQRMPSAVIFGDLALTRLDNNARHSATEMLMFWTPMKGL